MILVDNVSKRIRKTEVLKGISLELLPGRVTALVGPNGSGKTMLMRVIAGLVHPTEGFVEINGSRVGVDQDFLPDVGLLLEGPTFLDQLTGKANLKALASIRKTASEETIDGWIHAVGLDPEDRRKYRAYSLGMKQRLGIAAAFMEKPAVILLDEPTNALDASGVTMAMELIGQARDRGATVLLACHDAHVVRSVADEIWHMAEGHIESHEELVGRAG